MKKVFTLCFIVITASVFSQSANSYKSLSKKRAEQYFNEYSFTKAVEYYEIHLEKNPDDVEARLALAESYYKLNMPEESVFHYRKAVEDNEVAPHHYSLFSKMLFETEDYEEAKQWIEKYRYDVGKDYVTSQQLYTIENRNEFISDSSRYGIQLMDINSEGMDFAPSYYEDGLLFSSARPEDYTVKTAHKHAWDMQRFLDIYYYDGDTVTFFDDKINSKLHEGATYLNDHDSTLFFTRNNLKGSKKGKSDGGINKIKLYQAQKEKGKWKIKDLPFNSNNYSTGDPFYDVTSNNLLFISDMPGGFGWTDIYMVSYSDGTWGEPVNLGKDINTEGDERTPFFNKETGKLYFSSNAHAGLGGLDIFYTDFSFKEKASYEVVNMGFPINTSRDDFALILKGKDKPTGYLTSNRKGGKGQDDIYKFKIKSEPGSKLEGMVYVRREDQTTADRIPLDGADLEIWDKKENVLVKKIKSSTAGAFSAKLKPGKEYEIRASKDTLIAAKQVVSVSKEMSDDAVELTLVSLLPEPTKIIVETIIKNEKTGEPLEGVSIVFINNADSTAKKIYTDENGEFTAYLEPGSEYIMKLRKNGFITTCASFETPETPSREKFEFSVLPKVEKVELDKKFRIDNVYFDVAKWNIRPDAATELEKVVAFLKDNPFIVVELGSHTDARGSDKYNLDLSQKRAKSSVDFIVYKGISPDLIKSKGYGETQLTNRCKNGVRCTDSEHQANRRTEIKIVGILEDVVVVDEVSMLDSKGKLKKPIEAPNCQQISIK